MAQEHHREALRKKFPLIRAGAQDQANPDSPPHIVFLFTDEEWAKKLLRKIKNKVKGFGQTEYVTKRKENNIDYHEVRVTQEEYDQWVKDKNGFDMPEKLFSVFTRKEKAFYVNIPSKNLIYRRDAALKIMHKIKAIYEEANFTEKLFADLAPLFNLHKKFKNLFDDNPELLINQLNNKIGKSLPGFVDESQKMAAMKILQLVNLYKMLEDALKKDDFDFPEIDQKMKELIEVKKPDLLPAENSTTSRSATSTISSSPTADLSATLAVSMSPDSVTTLPRVPDNIVVTAVAEKAKPVLSDNELLLFKNVYEQLLILNNLKLFFESTQKQTKFKFRLPAHFDINAFFGRLKALWERIADHNGLSKVEFNYTLNCNYAKYADRVNALYYNAVNRYGDSIKNKGETMESACQFLGDELDKFGDLIKKLPNNTAEDKSVIEQAVKTISDAKKTLESAGHQERLGSHPANFYNEQAKNNNQHTSPEQAVVLEGQLKKT